MLKAFTKFVNFKAHNGLNKAATVATANGPLPETIAIAPTEPQTYDVSDLNWSDGFTEQDGTAENGTLAKPEPWFSSTFSTRHPGLQQEDQASSGKISFRGLTATSETAERLEALLCSSDRHPRADNNGCLNDIFQDMQKDSGSIHRW